MAPVAGSSGRDFEVELDRASFAALYRQVRAFDAELAKALRRRIRDVADPVVKEIRRTILGAPAKHDVGLRRGLAAGTKLRIRTGTRSAGVSIETTGLRLPEQRRAMVRAFNKRAFRHRTFGHDPWITQQGRPYFGAVIDPRVRDMQQAVELAVRDAAGTVTTGELNG